MLFAIISLVCIFISTGNKIEVKEAWLRTGAEGLNTALYFKIESHSDKPDTLYKVSSDIAKHVMMHETYMKDGMMGMREIKDIIVKPDSSVEFKPGSYHVMVMNLKKDLKQGERIDFVLHFKSAGDVNIQAEVQNR
ncbi:MAG: copper chaperone PCu(A)C [Ignavibacteriaceae bacterium]